MKESNTLSEAQKHISNECDRIKELLIQKNQAYGNSVFEPIKMFSKLDSNDQIKVRIDDKLSRILRGSEFPGDDTIDDLIGYLVLLKVAGKITKP